MVGIESRYGLMGWQFELKAENLIDQVENRVGYMQNKRNHCIHSHIQKCLIGIFGGMLRLGDFVVLRNVFYTGNKQAKQQRHQQREPLLEETVMDYPVFHIRQI